MKYDWDAIKACYIAGMSHQDICKQFEDTGITSNYLARQISTKGWLKEKMGIQAVGKLNAGTKIQDQVSDKIEKYLNFIQTQIEQEQIIATARFKTGSIKDQKERLDVLKQIKDLATETYGLQDRKPGDANADGYNFLIAIHSAPAGLGADQTAVSIGIRKGISEKIVKDVGAPLTILAAPVEAAEDREG